MLYCIEKQDTDMVSATQNVRNTVTERHNSMPFIGPRTLVESIISSGRKKEESSSLLYTFAGPPPGPVQPINTDTRASKIFRLCSEEAIDLVVEETNRYAAQCRGQCTSLTPRGGRTSF